MMNKTIAMNEKSGATKESMPDHLNMDKIKNKDESWEFHIRVLDGGFVLESADGEEYGYENVDDLLAALKDDLGRLQNGGGSKEGDMMSKKMKVQEMMDGG